MDTTVVELCEARSPGDGDLQLSAMAISKELSNAGDSRVRLRLGRGFKRCHSCGDINPQRALLCRNHNCKLRQEILSKQRPFDPVKLVTHSDYELYSVRCKERDTQSRSFVQIKEATLSVQRSSTIVSRNAICFVEMCKYDTSSMANSCRHIKACTESEKKPMTRAKVYSVAHEVLWNFNIPLEQKMKLWDTYKEDEQAVPAVQCLNASTFVAKCEKSKSFPAGRLHVHLLINPTKNENRPKYSCACKKLKIIVEPDNSVVMQDEICDHLLMVLAAVLSTKDGKTIYAGFTNALKSYWMPELLNTPLVDSSQEGTLFGFNINIVGSDAMSTSAASDDIFIFGNEFLSNENIPDFPDNILKSVVVNPPETNNCVFDETCSSHSDAQVHLGDPKLVSSYNIMEDSINSFTDITRTHAVISAGTAIDNCATHLELSDCNIELMDQFQQLTDQIDLCSEEMALTVEPSDILQADGISIVPVDLDKAAVPHINGGGFASSNTLPTVNVPNLRDSQYIQEKQAIVKAAAVTAAELSLRRNKNSLLKIKNGINNNNSSNEINTPVTVQFEQLHSTAIPMPATELPPIELPAIAMVRKEPLKARDIVSEVKTRYFPRIPAKRALVVNDPEEGRKSHIENVESGPALAYTAWLEYVIETINESIAFDSDEVVKHSFHVHEEIFAHFSKSFSTGKKLRMPTRSVMVKAGKHKDLIKYTWVFITPSTVKRVFTTRNLSIELERTFEKTSDGYVPFVKQPPREADKKHRRIYAKLHLFVAYIWFECGNDKHKTAFKIEWLPNAFPKSHYGILDIEFSLGYRYPQNI